MRQSNDKVWVYLVFLVLGVAFGLLAGGEIMRRILRNNSQVTQTSPQNVNNQNTRTQSFDTTTVMGSRHNAIVNATRTVAPCVVGIVVTQIQVVRAPASDDFFDFFFGPEMMPQYRQVESMGSGFVIRDDGLIMTNFHVVENAAKLFVNFPNGRQLEGNVIGFDERADLAIIAVKDGKFKTVKFGNSDDAMIGEWAIAIGNPFLNFINDAHPTVTVGVVSALDRNFAPSEGVYYQKMIQTDAAINPGNSGGPLVNALGEVIGINTFIYTGSSGTRGSIGIGFAIPINRARRVADELITFGQRRQVWTGISVQDLNKSIASSLGYSSIEGVVIAGIQSGSPGEKSGLKVGDIITSMGNRIIQSHGDLDGFFLDYFVGDTVRIGIFRKGSKISTNLRLAELPRQKNRATF